MKKTILVLFVFLFITGLTFSQSINIKSPHTGINWAIGKAYNIIWFKNGGMDANVKIRLYNDKGTRKIIDIVNKTPNDGNYRWTAPGSISEGDYIVRVKTIDNAVFDDSDVFKISVQPPGDKQYIIQGYSKAVNPNITKLATYGKIDGKILKCRYTPIFTGPGNNKLAGVELSVEIISNSSYIMSDKGQNGAGTFRAVIQMTTWDQSTKVKVKSRQYTAGHFSTSGKNGMIPINFLFPRYNVYPAGIHTFKMRLMFKAPIEPIGIEERTKFVNTDILGYDKYNCYLHYPGLWVAVWMDTTNKIEYCEKTLKLVNSAFFRYIKNQKSETGIVGNISYPCNKTNIPWEPGAGIL